MVHGELFQHLPHVDASFILLPSTIRSAGESVADWLQQHLSLSNTAPEAGRWDVTCIYVHI